MALMVAHKGIGKAPGRPQRNQPAPVMVVERHQGKNTDQNQRCPFGEQIEHHQRVGIKRRESEEESQRAGRSDTRHRQPKADRREDHRGHQINACIEPEEGTPSECTFHIATEPRNHQQIKNEIDARRIHEPVSQHAPHLALQNLGAHERQPLQQRTHSKQIHRRRDEHRDDVDEHNEVRRIHRVTTQPHDRRVVVGVGRVRAVAVHKSEARKPGGGRERAQAASSGA